MKKYLIAILLLSMEISCQKSSDSPTEESKIDLSKLTGFEWKSGKEQYPFWIYQFNSDNTGYQKHINNAVTGTYFLNNMTWKVTEGDTLRISFPQYGTYTERMRIFSISDSTLFMNDFNLSTGEAIQDTTVYYR